MNNIRDYKEYITKGNNAVKVTHAEEVDQQVSMLIDMNHSMAEAFELAKEKLEFEVQEQINNNIRSKRVIKELMVESKYIKSILKKSIPMHTIIFLIINTVVITWSCVLLFVSYSGSFNTIDVYWLWCALITGITLFATAFRALYDWRKMIYEKGENVVREPF